MIQVYKKYTVLIFCLPFFLGAFGQYGVLSSEYQKSQGGIDEMKRKELISQILQTSDEKELLRLFSKQDLSHLFSADYDYNGSIGNGHKRLRIIITSAQKDKHDSLMYQVVGASMVKNNICDFNGEITINSVIRDEHKNDDFEPPYQRLGYLYGAFKLYENKAQFGSGIFEGNFTVSWDIYDDLITFADIDYIYRESYIIYEGCWESYKTGFVQNVCWSNYILECVPSDFNCSDGPDIIPCKEYANEGWESLFYLFHSGEKGRVAEEIESEKWWEK